MKRAVSALVLAAWAGTGCVSLSVLWEEQKKPPVTAQAGRPRRPVTAEQITDSNAHQMADALLDEMDREAQGDRAPPAEKPVDSVKPAACRR